MKNLKDFYWMGKQNQKTKQNKTKKKKSKPSSSPKLKMFPEFLSQMSILKWQLLPKFVVHFKQGVKLERQFDKVFWGFFRKDFIEIVPCEDKDGLNPVSWV